MRIAVIIVIIVVALAIIAAIVMAEMRKRRTDRLRSRFGPEYDRVVEGSDGRHARNEAEEKLSERAERRDQLDIRELSPGSRARYADLWSGVQARFLDQPEVAVHDADALVSDVMRERGYPVDGFESRADMISVDHPDLVENYRAAHAVSVRHANEKGATEDLRQAMLHYRLLFDELLGSPPGRGISA